MAWNTDSQPSIPINMAHVCVLIPHWGSVQLEWVNSTYAPLIFIPQSDFAKSHRISRGIFNLDSHRNVLIKAALEDKTVTHILFLDSDVVVESPADPNQALRILLSLNVPIVSALYRAKKAKGIYPYAMWALNPSGGAGYIDIPTWTGNWLSVGAVGFGFILFKREVFEKTPYPWCEWHEPPNPSEDFWACEKFRKAGFEIKVFTDVKLSHIGTMKVKIDGSVHVLDV